MNILHVISKNNQHIPGNKQTEWSSAHKLIALKEAIMPSYCLTLSLLALIPTLGLCSFV